MDIILSSRDTASHGAREKARAERVLGSGITIAFCSILCDLWWWIQTTKRETWVSKRAFSALAVDTYQNMKREENSWLDGLIIRERKSAPMSTRMMILMVLSVKIKSEKRVYTRATHSSKRKYAEQFVS